jgi:hypothetical protein
LKRFGIVLRAAIALLALHCGMAAAEPGYYVVTAYDNPGVKTIDFRYWTVKHPGSPAVLWPEVGLGWNVTGRWYTEVLLSYVGTADSTMRLDTLNWQNDILLTQGQYPFDLAVHTLLVKPQHPSSGYAIEYGPALQTDFGRTQANLNLFLVSSFASSSSEPTELNYQWQLRHRWMRGLHVGAQGFGEFGQWDHWSPRKEQSHRAGPAVFGSVPIGGEVISWQAAYLIGKVYGQQAHMFSMRVKYEF